MDEWFGLFAANVWRYLDDLAARSVAERTPGAADLRKLAGAWRALLRLHEVEADGTCQACGRQHADACTVWQVAIGYFVGRLPGR
ncbi:MAG: hypothetical protein ACRDQ7_23775 [Haloechinothrix sp.]